MKQFFIYTAGSDREMEGCVDEYLDSLPKEARILSMNTTAAGVDGKHWITVTMVTEFHVDEDDE